MFEEAWGKTLFIDEISGICSPGAVYAPEAAKEMLTHLAEGGGRLVFCAADYEHNIDRYSV